MIVSHMNCSCDDEKQVLFLGDSSFNICFIYSGTCSCFGCLALSWIDLHHLISLNVNSWLIVVWSFYYAGTSWVPLVGVHHMMLSKWCKKCWNTILLRGCRPKQHFAILPWTASTNLNPKRVYHHFELTRYHHLKRFGLLSAYNDLIFSTRKFYLCRVIFSDPSALEMM